MVSLSPRRVAAVAQADLLIRLRRPITIVLLFGLCALAYLVIPKPESGRTLMQIGGQRALLNSAAIALATSAMGSLLLGFFGFYLISNTVRRDVVTRTGFILAATPITNVEYLVGKWVGNILFLGSVVIGYLASVMGMHLLRGEGPLQPLVYVSTYAIILMPTILVISALALLFECVPPLSGRGGDVLYFFVWLAGIAVVAGSENQPGWFHWQSFLDLYGMRYTLLSLTGAGATSISIGATSYDATLPPLAFGGLPWNGPALLSRVGTAIMAVLPLAIALAFFPRFDPARIKGGTQRGLRHPLQQVNRLLKPLTGIATRLLPMGPGMASARMIVSDAVLTLLLTPLLMLALTAAVVAPIALSEAALRGFLPAVFVALAVAVADIPTRDRTAGTSGFLRAVPGLQPRWLRWKFGAALLVAEAFVLVAAARLLPGSPASSLSLLVGAGFTAAAATALGVLTGTPKTFLGVFLFFLYVVLNSRGTPGLDFAGWDGAATGAVRAGYGLAGVVLLGLAAAKRLLSTEY